MKKVPRATEISGTHHHFGSTQMSKSPENGVTTPQGNVHGISNLYMAGTSLCPTGSYVNPTLTGVALSLYVVDELLGGK